MDILGEIDNDESPLMERHTPNTKAANLVINGALVEAKLLIYGKVQMSFLLPLLFNSDCQWYHVFAILSSLWCHWRSIIIFMISFQRLDLILVFAFFQLVEQSNVCDHYFADWRRS